MNMNSSRSHTILSITIESIDTTQADSVTRCKLQLVDLAGSERIKLTGTEGKQRDESITINNSLFVLRKVIKSLSETVKEHVPYRDSKLT